MSSVSVLVKRSYQIEPGFVAKRLDADEAFRKIDEYYDEGDPETSTIKYESELASDKQWTDVVIVGEAYAPEGKPCHQRQVSVSIANRPILSLVVSGDRQCHHVPGGLPSFSDPQAFAVMPIRYERSYGGWDKTSDEKIPFWYPRNMQGVGVVLNNVREAVQGLRLPNIESAEDRLTPENILMGDPHRWHLQPIPQGLGWRQKTWFPRCSLIGARPPFLDAGATLREQSMGWLPADYASLSLQQRLPADLLKFASGASFGLSFADLRGDEQVHLHGLTPDGDLHFALPADMPRIALDLGQGGEVLPTKLLTVLIQPSHLRLDMIWSGTHSIGEFRKWQNVKNLMAEVA
ncbi:MAG: DUF2169 domain-containing protein [Aureliella sp.]